MTRSTTAKAFIIAAVTAFALSVAPSAKARDKGCSNATLKGTFAHKGTGLVTAPADLAGPEAVVGTETFDGNGAITGTGTAGVNGAIFAFTDEEGTYKVNPDCTGTYTVQIPSLGLTGTNAIHIFFVIDDGANELQFIETDSSVVFSGVARRQFPVLRRREEADARDDDD